MKLIKGLEKFGLSEKESKTYLACLELGESSAKDISLKSKLPRTLTYDLLEKLIQTGLISYINKNNKKYFLAANPKELINILNEKKETITNLLPELNLLNKSTINLKPQVEVFEGKEGMKTVMNDILKTKIKEFHAYGSSRSSLDIIPAFMEEWHKKRIKQKISMNVIYNNTVETKKKLKRKKSLKLTNIKIMNINLESPSATVIYGDKIALQYWTKEPYTVVIKNKEMASNQKNYFKEMWKIAEKS